MAGDPAGEPAGEPSGDDDTRRLRFPQPSDSPPSPADDAPHTIPIPAVTAVPSELAELAEPSEPAVPSLPAVPAGDGGGPAVYGPPSYAANGSRPQGYGPPGFGPPGFGAAGYGQPDMRASAADRDRTIDVLRAAYGEGRLTKEEFESRAARTIAAKHYGELAVVVADLPAGPLGTSTPGYYPGPVTPTNGLAAASTVCSLVGLLLVPMAIAGVVMGHVARDQIRRTGERGEGFAVAGLAFGYISIAMWLVIITALAGVW